MMHGRERDGDNLRVYVLKVDNFDGSLLGGWGGTDITPSRFYSPLSFTYGKGSRVIDQRVIEEDPDGLGVKIKPLTNNCTVIEPLLLNQRDWFVLNVIVENPKLRERWYGSEGVVHAHGRIEGIRIIRRSLDALDYFRWTSITVTVGGLFLIGSDFILAPLLGYDVLPDLSEVGGLISIGYGFASGLIPVFLLLFMMYIGLLMVGKSLYHEAREFYKASKPKESGSEE